MRYTRPTMVPLSGRAIARGDDMLSCMAGTSPGQAGVCGTGSAARWNAGCQSGNATGDCAAGTSADFTCLAGAAATGAEECAFGTGGAPGACTVGSAVRAGSL